MPERKYYIEALSWAEAERDRELLEGWQELLRQRPPPNVLHSSPDWVDHLVTTGSSGVVLLVARDANGLVAGILPTFRHHFVLGHEFGSRVVPLSRLGAACVLGDVPLGTGDPVLASRLVAGALDHLPDCDAILLDSLPMEDRAFELFDPAPDTRGFLAYCLESQRHAYRVEIEGAFERYVERLPAKSRYNLRRAIKKLEEEAGDLELLCFRSAEQVNDLMREANLVKQRSWQKKSQPVIGGNLPNYPERLRDLARRGFLRSYLLRCGNTPCAFVIGYQGHGVYHYWEVGYDDRFAKHSPGTVLLYRLLEHLFATDRPRIFDFGRGDEAYKQRFATHVTLVATGLLLRATHANALRVRAHRLVAGSAARLYDAWQRGWRAAARGARGQ